MHKHRQCSPLQQDTRKQHTKRMTSAPRTPHVDKRDTTQTYVAQLPPPGMQYHYQIHQLHQRSHSPTHTTFGSTTQHFATHNLVLCCHSNTQLCKTPLSSLSQYTTEYSLRHVRPDITVMVDWALKINYLSIYLSRRHSLVYSATLTFIYQG